MARLEESFKLRYLGVGFIWAWVYCSYETSALYPDREGIYSWWYYRFKARENNAGWRFEYFLLSKRLETQLKSATIHTEIFGSDHCPVEVDLF